MDPEPGIKLLRQCEFPMLSIFQCQMHLILPPLAAEAGRPISRSLELDWMENYVFVIVTRSSQWATLKITSKTAVRNILICKEAAKVTY